MGIKNSKKTMVLIGICVILLVIFGTGGFFIIRSQMNQKSYSVSIERAEKYVEAGNYELAIVSYQNAIDTMPEKEDGYIGLATTYLRKGDTSAAKVTLKKGYLNTDSTRINYMMTGIEDGSLLVNYLNEEQEKELLPNNNVLALNTSFLQKLENFTYKDYETEYGGLPDVVRTAKGKVEVVHRELAATCYYANTNENEDIVNTKEDKPDAAGMPEKVSLDDISLLFRNFKKSVSLNELQKLCSSKVGLVKTKERTYVEFTSGSAVIRIETDANGTITGKNVWNEIILEDANKNRSKNGKLAGVVISATTGEGVSGAKLEFEGKSDKQNKESVTSKTDGSFVIELAADTYTVTITADGYAEESFEFEMKKDKNYSGEQFTISPNLAAGSARIVLEWGAQPTDLDSHLYATMDNGENFHIYFGDARYTSGGTTIAELDVDDRDGYGPETITLNNLNGKFTYRVEDFTNSGKMSENGATVKVYLPGKSQPQVITLGAGVENVWEVFELDHGEIKVLNRSGD